MFDDAREICERGDGGWFGAFLGDRLVAALGLLRGAPGTARYQSVETLSEHRGHGLASRLLNEASLYGREVLEVSRFVIVADPEYRAIRIYQSLGFEQTERQVQLQINERASLLSSGSGP